MEITAKNISKKSFFKLLLQSIGLGLIAFSILMGVFSLFGFNTVAWNDVYYTGFKGLLISFPLGLFIGIFFTCFMWVIGILGLWINSYFKGVSVEFKDVSAQNGE